MEGEYKYLQDSICKVIGVIGGVSWASSDTYYRRMNEIMRDRYGSLYSANLLLYSIPFHSFAAQERLAAAGDWTMMTATMVDAAMRLKAGGAEVIVIASNTLNSLASIIEEKVGVKVLNIVDVVGRKIVDAGVKKVILLGTKHTMENAFYKPTLLTNVTNDMTVAQEEIFGPVACVIKFRTEDEVIKMANDSKYGLGGAVWTRDINRAIRVARAIETGRMWVNTYNSIPAGAPFGGYKESGIGRETHKVILEHYTQMKNIMINLGESPTGFYPQD